MFFFLRFEVKKSPIVSDRTYITLQEVLANIGGLIKIIMIINKFANSLYSHLNIKRNLLKIFFQLNILISKIIP